MSVQTLVDPAQIESELLRQWNAAGIEKTRACLFNLIVFNKLSPRTDYIRDIVNKVSEKYPCRVLFISLDPESHTPYLKTAVSIVGASHIACDYIDIGVTTDEIKKVPFVLLPHIVPDLPVSLLWTESLQTLPDLFTDLSNLSTRIIFDSEAEPSLLAFSKQVLELKKNTHKHVADLNWARIEGWRELLVSLFKNTAKTEQITNLQIRYNARETEVFCHVKVQSFYLLGWIASRLKWPFQEAQANLVFQFENKTAKLEPLNWEKIGSGTILSIQIETSENDLYQCARIPEHYHTAKVEISTHEKCELPRRFILGQAASGHSLIKEIITKGTSEHYLEMLAKLSELDKDNLC